MNGLNELRKADLVLILVPVSNDNPLSIVILLSLMLLHFLGK
ncbi:hypothetical protein P7H70_09570 [Vagococcus carniphilus]|uniref:Uncharacterized protein n=1 Tax=Vagococcus carniphilus TaxID=218144 RepID=A0AAW8UBH1_9ENTE|nr:hypothetical protein [Vagococcus carniphilus]MDT2834308.1 hypothetical protein [Vagococcus carniphilus]